MKIKYTEQPNGDGILVYEVKFEDEVGYSTMGFNKDNKFILEKILTPEQYEVLLQWKDVEITDEQMSDIRTEWFEERHEVYKGIYFPKNTPKSFKKIIAQAAYERLPVLVIYEEGYESYPEDMDDAVCSEDGLTHVYYVGLTTGKKSPIALDRSSSIGGEIFMFSGIKQLMLIK